MTAARAKRTPTGGYRNANARTWGGRAPIGTSPSARYTAGGGTRMRGFRSNSSNVAEWANVASRERTQVRESARQLDIGNSIFSRILNTGVQNIIGNGPRVISNTADPGWNKAADDICAAHNRRENFTVEKIHSERMLSRLVWRSKSRDGGVLIYHPYNRVQVFEDGQICTPTGLDSSKKNRVKDGVQFTRSGAIEGYWVGPYSEFGHVSVKDAFFLPAWKIDTDFQVQLPRTIYWYATKFVSGYRGFSELGTAIDDLERIQDYIDAILERAVEEACIMGVLKSDRAGAGAGLSVGRKTDQGTASAGQVYDTVSYLEPGIVPNLAKDDEFEIKGITSPGREFASFFSTLVGLVGLSGSLPNELTLMKFNETNFSASRAAIDQAKMFWRMEQRDMDEVWTVPNRTWTVYEAIRRGELSYRDDWQNVNVLHSGWRYLQPKDDADATAVRLDTGETNLTQVLAERGEGLEDFLRMTAAEVATAARVSAETGVPVDVLLKHAAAKATGAENV